MPTLNEVKNQIAALPDKYIFWTNKEIRYLPRILNQNEHILALTSGMMNNRTWLAVCTNARVLFIDRGFFFGLRQVQINLDRLQTIESEAGLFFGTIRVYDAGSAMAISMVLQRSIAPFVRTVQEAMDKYKRQMVYDLARATTNALPQSPNPASGGPMLNELERLANLKLAGHLTDAEYTAAKAKLLQH